MPKLLRTILLAITLMLPWSGVSPLYAEEPPFALPPPEELQKIRSAVIETNKGRIVVELFPEEAPWHVSNFKFLADQGFYRNLRFHIHEPGYVIQTGAPGERVNSGPGHTLPPEFNRHKHIAGTLSMVRKPNQLDFDHSRRSHGSQFRIILKPSTRMDGYFTVFGRVLHGLEVAQDLRRNDIVTDIKVFISPDGH